VKQQEAALAATGETPEAADSPKLTKAQRQEIFRALVEAQDQRMAVAESRTAMAKRFGITEDQVRQIEEEGVDQEWPPL
jgi:ribonuclease HII